VATVTGLTAERMEAIEDASVVSGAIDGSGHLILTTFGGTDIDAGSALPALPVASSTLQGIVELATNAETITGTDATRATTPASVAAAAANGSLVPDASATVKGKVELATDAETITGTDTVRATTPANIAAALASYVPAASDTVSGKVELATDAETITGTDAVRAVTPHGLTAASTTLVPSASTSTAGRIQIATNAETITGTNTTKALTPDDLRHIFKAAYKGSGDTTRTDNTLTADPDLTFASLPTTATYLFDMCLWYKSDVTPGFKFGFTGPGVAGTDWKAKWSSSIVDTIQFDNNVQVVTVANTSFHFFTVRGYLYTGIGGTFNFAWAQNTTTGGTNTIVAGNSWWRLQRFS